MAEELSNEWTEESYSLNEALQDFATPVTALVDEGYMLNENESLGVGQIIKIQSQETLMQFQGIDQDEKRVCIPLNCPFKVKIVSPLEGRIFNSVKEIAESEPVPKYLKVLSIGRKEADSIAKGDGLKLILSERDPEGPTFLHFRNQMGRHFRLPVGLNGKFCECSGRDDEYSMSELVTKEFPFFIKFVVDDDDVKSPVSDKVGIIKLVRFVNETFAFCTTYWDGQQFMAAFPLKLDVRVKPIKNSKRIKMQPEDLGLNAIGSPKLKTTEEAKLESFRNSVIMDKFIDDYDYVRFVPFEDVEINDIRSLSTPKSESKSPDLSCENPYEIMDMREDDTGISRNDPKRKSGGLLSKMKSKLRGTKSGGYKMKNGRPEVVVVRDSNGAHSDGGDSGIYEEIPDDIYVSMDVVDGMRRAFESNAAASPAKVPPPTGTVTDGVPPPLPGNHPVERKHTVGARYSTAAKIYDSDGAEEKENFRKFYECMRRSEKELRELDVEGVTRILERLKLCKHVKRFQESKIDGKLLVDLDEAVFKDMGLPPFEARKLRKYVFGWRPDDKEKNNVECVTLNVKSNARFWSENEVEGHINSLGMTEFANFCRANQVNGDLLWDIVVDEDMIHALVNGKDRKLNVIKLKNYVTEGWRPKVGKKSSEDSSDTDSRSRDFPAERSAERSSESSDDVTDDTLYEFAWSDVASPSPKSERNTSHEVKDEDSATYEIYVSDSKREESTEKQSPPEKTELDKSENDSEKTESQNAYNTSEEKAKEPVAITVRCTTLPTKTEGTGNNQKKSPVVHETPVTRTASLKVCKVQQRSSKELDGYGMPAAKQTLSRNRSSVHRRSSGRDFSSITSAKQNPVDGLSKPKTQQQPAVSSQIAPRAKASPASYRASSLTMPPRKSPEKLRIRSMPRTWQASSSVVSPRSAKGPDDCAKISRGNSETRPKSRSQATAASSKYSPYAMASLAFPSNEEKGESEIDARKGSSSKQAGVESSNEESHQTKRFDRTTYSQKNFASSKEQRRSKISTGSFTKVYEKVNRFEKKDASIKRPASQYKTWTPGNGKLTGKDLQTSKHTEPKEKVDPCNKAVLTGSFRTSQKGTDNVREKSREKTSEAAAKKKENVENERPLQGVKGVRRSWMDTKNRDTAKQRTGQSLNSKRHVVAKEGLQSRGKEHSKPGVVREYEMPIRTVAQLKQRFDRK